MSSAYKGHYLNGSRETGFTAEAFKGPNRWKQVAGADGKPLRTFEAAMKRAIVAPDVKYVEPK